MEHEVNLRRDVPKFRAIGGREGEIGERGRPGWDGMELPLRKGFGSRPIMTFCPGPNLYKTRQIYKLKFSEDMAKTVFRYQ